MKGEKIVIIGAGFGGLAAAMLLAAEGKSVQLFDKRSTPGGKAYSFSLGPYRFDAGPSLFTLKGYFDDLFAETGASFDDYVRLIPLDPITRYFFPDGSGLYSRPLPGFLEEIERFSPRQAGGMEHYLSYAKKMYEVSEDMFLRNSLKHWKEGGPLKALANLFKLRDIDIFRTMHTANSRFVSDPRLVQLLDRFATYNGSNPYLAPAALNSIAWVEHGRPVYALRDGIAAIPQAMEKRARELGVEFFYESELVSLRPSSGRNTEHMLSFADGRELSARQVIADVDILSWYENILGRGDLPAARRYRRQPSSSSAVVFFWGVRRSFPSLGLHNIFFSSDYKEEFRQIHQEQRLPVEPTVYVNIGSKFTPEDAPEGCENWFVMVNAPWHEEGRDWSAEVIPLKKKVIDILNRELGRHEGAVDLESHIEQERILTPDLIERETGSYRGSLYGISSNTLGAAFMRHPNSSPYFRGMYHCGGSVHPGGGMPLALSSGVLAARQLLQHDLN